MAEPVYPRRSIAGPIVLIAIGTLLLLGNFHYLSWAMLAHWFARYWPALIILWGLVKLIEYMDDNRKGLRPRGIGAGGVFLLILLIIFGLGATSAERVNWGAVSNEMDLDNDLGSFFGNSYNFTQTLEQPFAGTSLRVVSDRGDITVNTWDQPKIKVVVTKKVNAENTDDAKKTDQETQPNITVDGSTVTLNANTNGQSVGFHGTYFGKATVQSNLEIYVPAKAAVDLTTKRGDVTVRQRTGDVHIATHGDATAENIQGNVQFEMRRGNVRAINITGDVATDGRVDDSTISQVTGAVRLSGDFFGDMNLSQIAKGVSFKSSRTDMEMARLDGTLAMQSGDLSAKSVTGPVRITTRSKDIHLEDFSGALNLENSNGSVELHAGRLPLSAMEVSNRRGEVQIVLPEKAQFELDASARRGDISSEFGNIKVENSGNESRASGVIGSGGPKVQITNDGGNVDIRKGTISITAPAPPPTPAAPAAPAGKAPKTQSSRMLHVHPAITVGPIL